MKEVQGMNWATALHPDDTEAYLDVYLQAFEERTPFEAQFASAVRMENTAG
jgi:hypothetical protein